MGILWFICILVVLFKAFFFFKGSNNTQKGVLCFILILRKFSSIVLLLAVIYRTVVRHQRRTKQHRLVTTATSDKAQLSSIRTVVRHTCIRQVPWWHNCNAAPLSGLFLAAFLYYEFDHLIFWLWICNQTINWLKRGFKNIILHVPQKLVKNITWFSLQNS